MKPNKEPLSKAKEISPEMSCHKWSCSLGLLTSVQFCRPMVGSSAGENEKLDRLTQHNISNFHLVRAGDKDTTTTPPLVGVIVLYVLRTDVLPLS
jgi:hypothetical protein